MTPRSTARRPRGGPRARAWRLVLALALLATLWPWPRSGASARELPADGDAVRVAAALEAGTTAIVRADGDCLRVRAAPTLAAAVLDCAPEGARVAVLEGATSADGLAWQRVRSARATGWAAERYLEPAGAAPACPAAAAAASTAVPAPAAAAPPPPALAGSLPRDGGFGLLVWSGGATAAIASAAEGGGCRLASVWANDGAGGFLHYHFGAPDFVNAAWLERFPGGELPPATALIARCAGETADDAAAGLTPAPSAAPPQRSGTQAIPNVSAYAGAIIDAASGATLWEKRAHEPLPPASLTKIGTAILAIESGKLDSSVAVDVDARLMTDSTVMGLRPGDCFQLRDLVYGLLLPSGNDAALAVGRAVAGSDAAFVEQLNALLRRLELRESRFANPHGLHEPGHVASASDLALLARYAMSLPAFAEVVRTGQWQVQGSRALDVFNTNSFLGRYAGADGVKTGFTEEAGRTLVASATRGGRRVIVALMNAPARYDDAQLLLDWVFGNFSWR